MLLDDFLALDRLLQRLDAAFFGGVEFQLHLFDVQQLLFELFPALGDFRQHAVQLFLIAAGGVVEFDQLAALGQGKPMRLPRRISFRLTLSRGE